MLAIAAAAIAALILTSVSMYLYSQSDASRIDASLPGREDIRSKLTTTPTITFEGSGSVDAAALADFQTLYDKEREALRSYGTFEGDQLEFSNLMSTRSNE